MTAGGGSQAAVRQAVLHGSFTLERDLAASPDRVFSGYADLSVRRRWFRMPGDPSRGSHELDFRIGGHEVVTGVFAPGGAAEEALSYRSTFWDLEPGARIVFSYSVTVDGVRRWASLVTVSLSALPLPTPTALPAGDGTRLRHTEQYACLAYAGDGAQDVAHLKGSLPLQLNGLAAALSATPLANLSWFWCDKSGENAVDFDANAVQVSWRSLGAARFLLLSRGGGLAGGAGGVSRRVVRAGLAGGWCGPG